MELSFELKGADAGDDAVRVEDMGDGLFVIIQVEGSGVAERPCLTFEQLGDFWTKACLRYGRTETALGLAA
jgi:hypothetical protein